MGGEEGRQNQKNVSTGWVHFHKMSVRHPRQKKVSFLLGVHLADWLSLDRRRQFGIRLCGLRRATGERKKASD